MPCEKEEKEYGEICKMRHSHRMKMLGVGVLSKDDYAAAAYYFRKRVWILEDAAGSKHAAAFSSSSTVQQLIYQR